MKNIFHFIFLTYSLGVVLSGCKSPPAPISEESQPATASSSFDNIISNSTGDFFGDDQYEDFSSMSTINTSETALENSSESSLSSAAVSSSPQFTLTVLSSGNKITGKGYEDSSGKINCNNQTSFNCSATFNAGDQITLSIPTNVQSVINGENVRAVYGGYWICGGQRFDIPSSGATTTINYTIRSNVSCGAYFDFNYN